MVVEAAADGTFHGQKPRRIGLGSMMPALSPDGQWLAWTDFTPRTGGMRVTGKDGRAFRTFEPSLDVQILPAWSDDSTYLAFWDVSRLGAILKIVDVEIGTTRDVMRVTHPRIWRRDLALEWIPGGHELLITPDAKPLVVLDITSGKQRAFHVPPGADMMDHPFISRDGHWLAFCDRDQHGPIHVVPLSTSGPARTLPVSAAASLLGWWPDGSLLEVHELTDSRRSSRVELWRRPLDGAPAEPLGITGTNMIYVTVSSDARRIAYSTQTFGQELWLLKPVDAN
jgi:Tol biopolymer transport system component